MWSPVRTTVLFVTLCLVQNHCILEANVKIVIPVKSRAHREAYLKEFPWAAAILNDKLQVIGAGALIGLRHVLTSCQVMRPLVSGQGMKSPAFIKCGDILLSTPASGFHKHDYIGETRNVSRVYQHPRCAYRNSLIGWQFDYAVAFVSVAFETSDTLRVIAAPPVLKTAWTDFMVMLKDEEVCDIVGWGNTTFEKAGVYTHPAERLINLKMKLMAFHLCQNKLCHLEKGLPTDAPNCTDGNYLQNQFKFCARTSSGDDVIEGPCVNDIGAPLTCRDEFYGIVSDTPYCGEKGAPATFSAITPIRVWSWIQRVMDSPPTPSHCFKEICSPLFLLLFCMITIAL